MGIDRFGCLNNTIKVAAGTYFDLAAPDASMVDLCSIAAALSKICRFGGHCPRFYSVAEHCVQCYRLARDRGYRLPALRAVLMHDAAESYIGDVVKPLKVLLPEYACIEAAVEDAISERLLIDFAGHAEAIKEIDRALLKAEKVAMWPNDAEQWEGFSDIETPDVRLEYWEPSEAESHFLYLARCAGIE